jgi:hypothetical protein
MKSTHTPGHMTIGELRKGMCSEQLRQAIQEATERTKATRKKSKVQLTLTIDLADEKAEEVEMVTVIDDIKLVLPKLPQKQTFFYIHPETSALLRENPAQFIDGVKDQKDVKTA